MNDQERSNEYAYIEHDLGALADTNALIDQLEIEMDNEIDQCIPAEILMEMDDIRDKYDAKMSGARIAANELRELIKKDVLEHGATVQGKYLIAVWNKGRISWDPKALKGYAVVHPEINQLRKQGDPTVTIRKVR